MLTVLMSIQIFFGIAKVCFAFTDVGSRRQIWHLGSGLAIIVLGIIGISVGH